MALSVKSSSILFRWCQTIFPVLITSHFSLDLVFIFLLSPILYGLIWILRLRAVPLLLQFRLTSCCSCYQMVAVVLVALVAAVLVA
jgi:hypothetical protein